MVHNPRCVDLIGLLYIRPILGDNLKGHNEKCEKHLKSEKHMKSTPEKWKAHEKHLKSKKHMKSEKHMKAQVKSTWKVKTTWKAPEKWKAHEKWKVQVKITWKECAPHASLITGAKICTIYSICSYSEAPMDKCHFLPT